jgi:hypothetical protein
MGVTVAANVAMHSSGNNIKYKNLAMHSHVREIILNIKT